MSCRSDPGPLTSVARPPVQHRGRCGCRTGPGAVSGIGSTGPRSWAVRCQGSSWLGRRPCDHSGSGVPRVEQGRGTSVNPPARWVALDPALLTSRPALEGNSAQTAQQITETRCIVEVGAAEPAARRRAEVDVDGLRDCIERMHRHTRAVTSSSSRLPTSTSTTLRWPRHAPFLAALLQPIKALVREVRRHTSLEPDMRLAHPVDRRMHPCGRLLGGTPAVVGDQRQHVDGLCRLRGQGHGHVQPAGGGERRRGVSGTGQVVGEDDQAGTGDVGRRHCCDDLHRRRRVLSRGREARLPASTTHLMSARLSALRYGIVCGPSGSTQTCASGPAAASSSPTVAPMSWVCSRWAARRAWSDR